MKKNISGEVYWEVIFREFPRIIANLNRNPLSSCFGCFDRDFWHYHITDLPGARKQEAVLTLALVYETRKTGNIYFHSGLLLSWINAALNFWKKIQRPNGSFNEWYPNEDSYVATVFSSYAVSEVLLLLKNKIQKSDDLIQALGKSVNFLSDQKQLKVQNQQTALPILYYNFYRLTGEKRYRQEAKKQIGILQDLLSEEGWFSEYGGADFGYHTVAIDYLTKYWEKTQCLKTRELVKLMVSFLVTFIDRDIPSAGYLGSRNTQYLIPHGLELMAKEGLSTAITACRLIREMLSENRIVGPGQLDDRYLLYNGYTYLQAYGSATALSTQKETHKPTNLIVFKKCGLVKYRSKYYKIIINVNKGGVFKAVSRGQNYLDGGVSAIIRGKAFISAKQAIGRFRVTENHAKIIVQISGVLSRFKDYRLSSGMFIGLRGFQLVFGRSQLVNRLIKDKFRNLLIMKSNQSKITFDRELIITPSSLTVKDRVSGLSPDATVWIGPEITDIYVPSSRYFEAGQLDGIISEKPLKAGKNGEISKNRVIIG